MANKRAKRGAPEIIYIRKVSKKPGRPEELERILLQWDLMLVRKAQQLLESSQRTDTQ